MTILEKLTFSDKTQAAVMTSPEARIRRKMLDAIDIQIAAAEAQANGETYVRRAPRWITDPETGERVRKDVPVRFRRWWWKAECKSEQVAKCREDYEAASDPSAKCDAAHDALRRCDEKSSPSKSQQRNEGASQKPQQQGA